MEGYRARWFPDPILVALAARAAFDARGEKDGASRTRAGGTARMPSVRRERRPMPAAAVPPL